MVTTAGSATRATSEKAFCIAAALWTAGVFITGGALDAGGATSGSWSRGFRSLRGGVAKRVSRYCGESSDRAGTDDLLHSANIFGFHNVLSKKNFCICDRDQPVGGTVSSFLYAFSAFVISHIQGYRFPLQESQKTWQKV